MSDLNPAFDHDKFLLRQKHFALGAEKYYVWDEHETELLYVERPHHVLRNLIALTGGGITALFICGIFFIMGTALGSNDSSALQIVAGIFLLSGIIGGFIAGFVIQITLSQKRHISFYQDDSRQKLLLEVLQDQKFQFLIATYTVNDPNGETLAKLEKNYLYNFFRKQWRCLTPTGNELCLIKEDSWIKSILRRFLGTLFGLLRTNFIIVELGTEKKFGEFNRKFTLLDRYVLDMSPDISQRIDRRVAVAIGVLLDTGERR